MTHLSSTRCKVSYVASLPVTVQCAKAILLLCDVFGSAAVVLKGVHIPQWN